MGGEAPHLFEGLPGPPGKFSSHGKNAAPHPSSPFPPACLTLAGRAGGGVFWLGRSAVSPEDGEVCSAEAGQIWPGTLRAVPALWVGAAFRRDLCVKAVSSSPLPLPRAARFWSVGAHVRPSLPPRHDTARVQGHLRAGFPCPGWRWGVQVIRPCLLVVPVDRVGEAAALNTACTVGRGTAAGGSLIPAVAPLKKRAPGAAQTPKATDLRSLTNI